MPIKIIPVHSLGKQLYLFPLKFKVILSCLINRKLFSNITYSYTCMLDE